jgi:eukaryotic-like serine/threonine-protein kinase
MTPERWEQIDQVFQAAVALPELERGSFLSERCGRDDTLRLEVESLLVAKAEAGSFLDTPAIQVAARALTQVQSPVNVGQVVGVYRILSQLGAGGMGEVWRARDIRVNRDVAIKFCDGRFTERFEREARAIAALNHPNICHLYDVGPNYLVMELVEGEPLRGPVPVETALDYARQIADALEAAHEKGIIHRDLKPGNVRITPAGVIKVLDFGLAKALPGTSAVTDPSISQTVAIDSTEAGMILGTAAYMAPEQAQGKPVDKRADIWAFGVVLYELLTGQALFLADTAAETLATVLTKGPAWESVPVKVQPLLRRCLVKDPKRRLRDIGDAMALVEPFPASRPAPRTWLPWSAALLLVSSMVLAFISFRDKRPARPEPVRLHISLPETLNTAGRIFTLSPDGRKLAFSAVGPDGVPRVWVRFMDSLDVRELPGSETTPNAPPFFWSPDSRFIAYSAPGAKLRKVDLAGSPPQSVCDTTGFNAVSGSWHSNGVIIFGSTTGGLTRVSASGGATSAVTVLDQSRKEIRHAFPTFLRDGRRFVYLRTSVNPENSGWYMGSLDVPPEKQDSRKLLTTTFGPVYAPSREPGHGRLLVLREGTVFAQTFDEERLELLGDPVAVVHQVGTFLSSVFVSVSLNGVLVYRSGVAKEDTRLQAFDRQGHFVDNPEQPGGLSALALSPGGDRAALVRRDSVSPLNGDIWAWDIARANSIRLTFDPRRAEFPVWFPGDDRIVFASNREGPRNLYRKLANESKGDEVLVKSRQDKIPTSISRDGNFLLYTQTDPVTKNDIWLLTNPRGNTGDRKSTPLMQREFNESEARFSPVDTGATTAPRWVAYTSDESGRNEVYVREFQPNGAGRKWQVSRAGGSNPRWRADAKELFFAALDETVMAAEIAPSNTFQAGTPKSLFRIPSGVLPNWDVMADGTRLLILLKVQHARAPFTVVLNWQEGLTK